MEKIDRYIRKPKSSPAASQGRFEIYNLSENPFPSTPFVNPESNDARINGAIYEPSIRESERKLLLQNFLQVPQNDPQHLRLGYIIDASYIGRGNGKSAFLINLQREINQDFGLSISNDLNKCFSLTIHPEIHTKVKSFESFVDLFVNIIFSSEIVDDALSSLRLDAIMQIYPNFDPNTYFSGAEDLRAKLNSINWYYENKLDYIEINKHILNNKLLQELPSDFPLYLSRMFVEVSDGNDFKEYYYSLKRGALRYSFVFTDLVSLFLAAGFNGAYIFVDDFERIPNFQTARQRIDFAVELRTCLFDGMYTNAKIGFYNFILVLHAGVPALVQEAWEQSGLEHRSPIALKGAKNVIIFEKIRVNDAFSLLKKYLQQYRIHPTDSNTDLVPFERDAIEKIAEQNEFNASKILKKAHEDLDRAANSQIRSLDVQFVQSNDGVAGEPKKILGIHDALTKNLNEED